MIEETALVVEVRDQQALLQTQRKSACQSCSVKSGCGTSTLSKVVGNRSSQFVVDNTLGVQAGDQVVVAIEESALVQGSLLIYLLPLVLMLLAGILAEFLFSNESITILFSIIGLVLSMIVVRYILSLSHLKKTIHPQLLRRIP